MPGEGRPPATLTRLTTTRRLPVPGPVIGLPYRGEPL